MSFNAHEGSHRGHETGGHGPVGGQLRPGHAAQAASSDGKTDVHDKHAGHSVELFRRKFWLSLALTVPTLAWSEVAQEWLGFTMPPFPGSRWIPAVFGTLVFFLGGWNFLRGAVRELRGLKPGMMTLISLAISVAFVFSVAVALGLPGMPLWWELATLVTIMLLGHWMEMRSINQAKGALRELAKLLPNTAVRLTAEATEEVPIVALRAGDLVLVRPGASVPADGLVLRGSSDVDESMITGESRLVRKQESDRVIAGTVNQTGSLRVEVTGVGEQTALAGIMRLVAQAQTSRSRAQALADRAAYMLTIVAVLAGSLTASVWLAIGPSAAYAIERTVSVLVVACPHALGLAIPLVVSISTTLGARSGLLVRDRRGLEEARNLDAVVFDKTGTLTLGEHRVVAIHAAAGMDDKETLRLAAAVEQDSQHPVARAFLASARESGLEVPAAEGFDSIPGQGVKARVEGRDLLSGGPNLLRALTVETPPDLATAVLEIAKRGQGAIYLLEDRRVLAAFAVADKIRDESREAVRRLHAYGIEVVMLTGDARSVAESVAADLGIDTVLAEVLPGQKADVIRGLQADGKRVAMVGDGVNDAPALATSDVGVAIGAGTDVAVEAGDVVLVRNDPRDVARIIELSKATYRKMLQNLWWAAGYNVVAVPLAAGVFAGLGIVLHPALAAVLMSTSTIIVALNAQLLRRTRLGRPD